MRRSPDGRSTAASLFCFCVEANRAWQGADRDKNFGGESEKRSRSFLLAFYILACLTFATAHFCAYLGALRITKWIKVLVAIGAAGYLY